MTVPARDRPELPPQRAGAEVDKAVTAKVVATAEHLELVESFIAEHGEHALADALTYGHIFEGMRAQSRFSVRAAILGASEGVPGTLLLQFRAKPKSARAQGENLEARYLQGEGQQLTIDLHVRGG